MVNGIDGPSNARTILLVEDDEAILDTLWMFLGYEGYNVLRSQSVQQVRTVLSQHRPDLVLLDYMLGEDTAEPVMAEVRRRYGIELPVILLSAVDEVEYVGRTLGVDAVMSKPFELDSLLRAIRKQLSFKVTIPRDVPHRVPGHAAARA